MTRKTTEHLDAEELMQFLLDQVPPEQQEAIESHLEQCDLCTQELEELFEAYGDFSEDQLPAVRAELEREWQQSRPRLVQRLRQIVHASESPLPAPTWMVDLLDDVKLLDEEFENAAPASAVATRRAARVLAEREPATPRSRHPFARGLAAKTKQPSQRLRLDTPDVWIMFWEKETGGLSLLVVSEDALCEGQTVCLSLTDPAGTPIWVERGVFRKSAPAQWATAAMTLDRGARIRLRNREVQVRVELFSSAEDAGIRQQLLRLEHIWGARLSTGHELHNAASELYRMGRYLDAVAVYDLAIGIWPDRCGSYFNRGLANLRLGRYELAEADLGQVIDRRPALAAAFFTRGLVRECRGQYKAAIGDYNRALQIEPWHEQAQTRRQIAIAKTGQV